VVRLAGLTLDLADKRHMYWLALLVVAAGFAVTQRIVASPFGAALVAIRESEERAAAIGIDVDRHKRLALVISGALSGLAGVLFAIHQNFVSPELLYFALSGEVVIIAVLGGLGTLYGAIVGAVIAVGIREVLSTWTDNWLVFLGALYVICVMWFPQGLVRLARR
jgi:branched-chain amino acid transport system permease protein